MVAVRGVGREGCVCVCVCHKSNVFGWLMTLR